MNAAIARLFMTMIVACSMSMAAEPTPKPAGDPAKSGDKEKAAAPTTAEDKGSSATTEQGQPSRRRVEDGVLVIPAEELGVTKKGSFRPLLIGREVAQLKRLFARLETGIELKPEQKTKLNELFAKAERDVRSDRVDPRVIDPNPKGGVLISDGSEDAALCDPSKAPPSAQAAPGQATAKDEKHAAAATGATKVETKTKDKALDAKTEGKPASQPLAGGPLQLEPNQKVRVELPPGFDAPPVRLNEYVFGMRDQMRELLDDAQESTFEVLFERWRVMHPMGPSDGPYTRLMRLTRDPQLNLSTEKETQLRKIIIDDRKLVTVATTTPMEERVKAAEITKTKMLAELNDDQRKAFNSALGELEADDALAAKVAEEYRVSGVRVQRE